MNNLFIFHVEMVTFTVDRIFVYCIRISTKYHNKESVWAVLLMYVEVSCTRLILLQKETVVVYY